jgi:hypothetical protein
MTSSDKLTAALEYIVEGFKVFPVSIDKTPLTPHGLKDATQTQQGVRGYWTKYPDAGIGIVTDNLIVLDFDAKSGGLESRDTLEKKYGLPQTRIHGTGGGGFHYIYKNPNGTKVKNATNLGGYPGFDVRGNGGYIVAPPSLHESGNTYMVYDYSPIVPAPAWFFKLVAPKEDKPLLLAGSAVETTIPQGERNATLTHIAGKMRHDGHSEASISAALTVINNTQCQPPLPVGEVLKITKSVSRYQPVDGGNTYIYKYIERNNATSEVEHNKNATESATHSQQEPLSKRVEEWVKNSGSRWFETPELDRDLGITSTSDKNNRREIMLRLKEKGIIEQHPKIQKQFRFINKQLTMIDFKNASSAGVLPLRWPLGIEQYVNLFPGNLAVVAGATNAGKTALLLNVVYLNHLTFPLPIYYFCSEMGDIELKERLELFEGMSIEKWNWLSTLLVVIYDFS